MNKNKDSLKSQIHRNLLAIISLFIAITALTYNSWRQELTEDNRNLRLASFELIMQLGELQLIVDHAHYDHDKERGNPITGWGRVALIEDLSAVLPAPLPEKSIHLKQAWSGHWEGLGKEDVHVEQITTAIQSMREEVRDQLTMIR
jgi:hypothetical protein